LSASDIGTLKPLTSISCITNRSIFANAFSASDLCSASNPSNSELSTTNRKNGALGGRRDRRSLELKLFTPSAPIDWKGVVISEVLEKPSCGKRVGIVNKEASLPLLR